MFTINAYNSLRKLKISICGMVGMNFLIEKVKSHEYFELMGFEKKPNSLDYEKSLHMKKKHPT